MGTEILKLTYSPSEGVIFVLALEGRRGATLCTATKIMTEQG